MSVSMANIETSSSASSQSTNISYTKANEFLKLLDEERPAQELLLVLKPGTYRIGKGGASLLWDGKLATHTPPAGGEVEVYDYLVQSRGFDGGDAYRSTGGITGLGRHSSSMSSVGHGGERSSQNASWGGAGAGEVQSPWARGWASFDN